MQPKTMDDEQVDRAPDPADARVVRVELTPPGRRALVRLSALPRDELRRIGTALIPPDWSDPADGES